MNARARPRRLDEIMAFCHRIYRESGHAPSYSMIRDECRITDNATVRQYVKRAEAEGLLTLGEYTGGRGPRRGQRIRLGLPEEADKTRIKMGRDL